MNINYIYRLMSVGSCNLQQNQFGIKIKSSKFSPSLAETFSHFKFITQFGEYDFDFRK